MVFLLWLMLLFHIFNHQVHGFFLSDNSHFGCSTFHIIQLPFFSTFVVGTLKSRAASHIQKFTKDFAVLCFSQHLGQVSAKRGHENVTAFCAALFLALREMWVLLDIKLKKVVVFITNIQRFLSFLPILF